MSRPRFTRPNVGDDFDAEVARMRKARARRASRAKRKRAGGRDKRRRAIGH